jgi:hypothetical protein
MSRQRHYYWIWSAGLVGKRLEPVLVHRGVSRSVAGGTYAANPI